MDGNPKSRNGGMVEWQKMTPNPKTCLYKDMKVFGTFIPMMMMGMTKIKLLINYQFFSFSEWYE